MSNTYFKIEKEHTIPGYLQFPGYTNKYELSLTAFCGGENHTQLTIQTVSSLDNQGGTAYIVLNDADVDKLIFGLFERKLNLISATADEQSRICPNREENGSID